MDGKLLPAIPINLALKYRPPTIAVVYKMKDVKSGRMKKYIHEIKITFEPKGAGSSISIDIIKLCDEICRKETIYLNPAYIGKSQVSSIYNYYCFNLARRLSIIILPKSFIHSNNVVHLLGN